jgi:hypothetical protein
VSGCGCLGEAFEFMLGRCRCQVSSCDMAFIVCGSEFERMRVTRSNSTCQCQAGACFVYQ